MKFPVRPDLATGNIRGSAALKQQDDYVVCIVGARHQYFPDNGKSLAEAPGADLQRIAAGLLQDWPPGAAGIVASGDPSACFAVGMYTSVPCQLGQPGNVTLLGDAIHAMTPTLGRGANLALRDGALLGRQLKAVADGTVSVPQALAAYEGEMLRYGFDVVRESVVIGEQRIMRR